MEIELKLKMENAQNIVLYFIRNSNNSNQAVILKSKNTHTQRNVSVCVCDHRSVYFALVMKFAQIFYNYGVCLLLRVDALIDMEKLESVKLQKKQKGQKIPRHGAQIMGNTNKTDMETYTHLDTHIFMLQKEVALIDALYL